MVIDRQNYEIERIKNGTLKELCAQIYTTHSPAFHVTNQILSREIL